MILLLHKTLIFSSFPERVRLSSFLFLPDDSGSPIFILSSLSVVENTFGLRDGTGNKNKSTLSAEYNKKI